MYRENMGSILATMDVNDGLLSTPGDGWMTSAPMIIAGFCRSARNGTDLASGTVLIPPSLTLILEIDVRSIKTGVIGTYFRQTFA
jgi:hypothetical protein